MYVYDSAIDDSDFHNGSSIVEKTPDKYTDGTLSLYSDTGTNEYSAKYSFSRRSGEYSSFSLTPDETSFYKLTNEASSSAYIFVSYEKKTLWWSETISVEQEEDGTYLLNGGTEYTIETYGVQSGGYNFTVEQDNWVYAPNGGMWEVVEYEAPLAPLVATTKRMFITPQLLAYATMTNPNEYTIYECHTIDEVNEIMAIITYEDPDAQKSLYDNSITCVTVGGVVLVLVSLIPGVREGTLIYTICQYGGGACTLIGGLDWFLNQLDISEYSNLKNAMENGNLSIIGSYTPSNTPLARSWEAWETVPYINKFQMGNRGKVTEITSDDVKSWLPFKS